VVHDDPRTEPTYQAARLALRVMRSAAGALLDHRFEWTTGPVLIRFREQYAGAAQGPDRCPGWPEEEEGG
jgi:hypothetical protein